MNHSMLIPTPVLHTVIGGFIVWFAAVAMMAGN